MSKKPDHNESTPPPPTQNDEVLTKLLESLTDDKEKQSKRLDPLVYLEILLRRRWYFLVPMLLVAAIGLAVVIKLPKIYEATTLILVQPQKVPSDYVRPVVADDIESRISTISQQINSRSNLEAIIAAFDLFAHEDQQKMFIEDKIENLRRRITVDLHRKSRRDDPDSFSVSFRGKDPRTITDVANALAQNFIDENLKIRESQVESTDAFIENQLDSMRGRLQELEGQLQDYRARYMGGLPEQLDTNLQMLERLETQLSDKQESIRDAKNRLLLINQQMTDLRGFQDRMVAPAVQGQAADNPALDDRTRLALLRQELSDIETRYTDQHPDIIRLRERVVILTAKIEAQEAPPSGEEAGATGLGTAPPYLVQQMTSLLAQRTEAQQEIASLERDIPKLNKQIAHHRSLIDDTPKREQELQGLKRDYANLTASYKSLLDRKHQAEIALSLERTRSGEQFRILDMAQLPTKPAKPDMRKLFVLIVGLAVGAGAGLVVVLEYLDSSFKRMDDAAAFLNLPLLATLPLLENKQSRRKLFLNNAMTLLSIAIVIGLLGTLGIMSMKGVEPTLAFFRQLFPV